MLRALQVRDFVIFEQVELELAPGLTVLTGETGAGKSLLVDALELLAGARADAGVVRTGAERADLTATLDIRQAGAELRTLLQEQSISHEGELLLRRVIGSDGRSRAWLNGQSVPVQMLRTVSELLIDIHGQHEFQALVRPATQRQLVDSYGKLESLCGQVETAHRHWFALLNRSLELEAAAGDRHARLDLLRYQAQELEALQLREGELAALAAERERISHHARLHEAARSAHQALYENDEATADALLARAIGSLRNVAGLDVRLAALLPPLEEAEIRLRDVARDLAHYQNQEGADPARQQEIEKRLAAIEDLARKHRVAAEALPARLADMKLELARLENAATDLGSIRASLQKALADYHELARQLSAHRSAAARNLARDVSARMQELGMPGGRFTASVEPSTANEPSPHGIDTVEFRVSTNAGQPPRAVARIASGGELSRLSLAVQVTCSRDAAPCMVFDEVDSGIGGAVAEIVGRELRALGQRSQVLCVTHLPQVAAQAHQHLRVNKLSDGRSTRTTVTALGEEARVEELARMLGGVQISSRARAHATEMLQSAANPPPAPATQPRPRRGKTS